MQKPKSRSLMIADSLPEELKEHIMMLQQRQLQIVRQKLQRQQEKQQRVNALEKEFVDWADRKQEFIRQKISKSTKNKEDYLNKVVRKCKDHEKHIGEKLKIFKTKKRDNLKQAWKKAEQFNSNIEEYHTSKHVSKDRSVPKFKADQNQSESRIVDQNRIYYEREPTKEYLSLSYNNASKFIDNTSKFIDNTSKNMLNPSKEYWRELNQSIKQLKYTEQLPDIQNEQRRQRNEMANNKLKQTLARFRQHIQSQEQQKIQQLGQRLQKIEKSRQKKIQLNKKKSSINQHTIQDDSNQRNSPKKKANRSQRVNSESEVRKRRAEDWSFPNKKKREQLFQMNLQHGTEYLQHQKLKYMKTTLAKKIAGSAIQKKLYFQRLNH